jgi:hypothetical protein
MATILPCSMVRSMALERFGLSRRSKIAHLWRPESPNFRGDEPQGPLNLLSSRWGASVSLCFSGYLSSGANRPRQTKAWRLISLH